MRPDEVPARTAEPGQSMIRLAASLLLVAGLALLFTGYWWARPVIELLEGLPGGKWLSVPVPYLPIIAVALGVKLLARRAVRARAP